MGQWHKQVPKDAKENVEFRRWLLGKCQDPVYRDSVRSVCSQDILFYLNAFVWAFDPRLAPQGLGVQPFVTWGFQDEAVRLLLDSITSQRDVVIEKSRDMGASWLCLLTFEWLWHFRPWMKFLCISRNEDLVDSPDDSDSLFWKLDHVHRHLPAWLMPEGYLASGAKAHRKSLVFKNPETHSTITGQATTRKAGIGGRATAMLLDEFSQIDQADEVLKRTADTTGCRIFNFTHIGTDTAAYRLTLRPDIRKLKMHWTQHPAKGAGAYHWDEDAHEVVPHDPSYRYEPGFAFVTDGTPTGGPHPGVRSPWYDQECIDRDDSRAVACDLDIDARGSTSLFFDPLQIRSYKAQYARPPVWQGDLYYDRDRGRPLDLVPSPTGSLKLWVEPDPYGKMPEGLYFCGNDVAMGTGATPSCSSVIRMPDGLKVAEYADAFVTPDEFAAFAVSLCWLFKGHSGEGAMMIWEADGGGGVKFGQEVVDKFKYLNVYYRTDEFKLAKVKSDKPGWYAAAASRKAMWIEYRAALTQRRVVNRSEAALDELHLIVYTPNGHVEHAGRVSTNDPTGARENHGDRGLADGIAWWIARDHEKKQDAPAGNELVPGSLAWRRRLSDDRTRELQES